MLSLRSAPKTTTITERVRRPLYWWMVASFLLFAWNYHDSHARRANIRFSVALEGQETRGLGLLAEISLQTTLNGEAYKAGTPSGIGRKRLLIQMPPFEPFETNLFVWYGGSDFGRIVLPRPRGYLELSVSSEAEQVRITGPDEPINNPTNHSLLLPTGRYRVMAKFTRFTIERTVEVNRNQTTALTISPSLTTLNLTSEPDNAYFTLKSKQQSDVSVAGQTPASLAGMPAGDYEMTIAIEGYRKNQTVSFDRDKVTNDLRVEFRYAKLSITSDPPDATVTDGPNLLGKTPVDLDLPPGEHTLRIEKEGYFGTNIFVVLTETAPMSLSLKLVNVSFTESLTRARLHSSGLMVDLDRALADVEEALKIKPTDETALRLKRTIEFNRHIRDVQELTKRGDYSQALAEAEAAFKLGENNSQVTSLRGEIEKAQRVALDRKVEARREHPGEVFQQMVRSIPYEKQFDLQALRLTGTVDDVQAAVIRALGRKPAWALPINRKDGTDTVVINAELKGFLSKQSVVMVIGQATDSEVRVFYKYFPLVSADGGQFSLRDFSFSGMTYRPEIPGTAEAAKYLRKRQDRELDEFKKRLEEELH